MKNTDPEGDRINLLILKWSTTEQYVVIKVN